MAVCKEVHKWKITFHSHRFNLDIFFSLWKPFTVKVNLIFFSYFYLSMSARFFSSYLDCSSTEQKTTDNSCCHRNTRDHQVIRTVGEGLYMCVRIFRCQTFPQSSQPNSVSSLMMIKSSDCQPSLAVFAFQAPFLLVHLSTQMVMNVSSLLSCSHIVPSPPCSSPPSFFHFPAIIS